MRAYVKNAADPNQVQAGERKERLDRTQEMERIAKVFGGQATEARRVLCRWLAKFTGYPNLAIHGDPVQQSRISTAFAVGQDIVAELHEADPHIWITMQTEEAERARQREE